MTNLALDLEIQGSELSQLSFSPPGGGRQALNNSTEGTIGVVTGISQLPDQKKQIDFGVKMPPWWVMKVY